MPRPKVDPRFRKRIAKACVYCRMTKQKRDGLTPYGQCMRRDRSTSCAYSPHEQSFGRRRNRRERMHYIPETVPQAVRGAETSTAVSCSLPKADGTEGLTQSYGETASTNRPEVTWRERRPIGRGNIGLSTSVPRYSFIDFQSYHPSKLASL